MCETHFWSNIIKNLFFLVDSFVKIFVVKFIYAIYSHLAKNQICYLIK